MKIAYFSFLPIADVDFSYLHEAQQIMDVTCYMFILPHHVNRSVISFHTNLDKSGVYEATDFRELLTYKNYLNLDKVKVINIANTRYWQFDALRIVLKLVKQFNREYDLVHLTRIPQWFEFPFLKLRRKIVLSVHDPIPHSGLNPVKRMLMECLRWITYSQINNYIIFNKSQKEGFVERYRLYNKNVITSKLSCYTCLQPILLKNVYSSTDSYILFIGRITQYKGLQYLLPAFKDVHKKHPNIKLVVAGSGKFNFNIEDYTKLDYIEFRNRFIPDVELIELMKGCLFMVCPYTDATQSGVIMSAFAFNVPVLATNVGGLPEMVKDHYFGRIVSEKDKNSLVNGLCEMLSDLDKVKQYSENIKREYSTGILSWKYIAEDLKQEYLKCI